MCPITVLACVDGLVVFVLSSRMVSIIVSFSRPAEVQFLKFFRLSQDLSSPTFVYLLHSTCNLTLQSMPFSCIYDKPSTCETKPNCDRGWVHWVHWVCWEFTEFTEFCSCELARFRVRVVRRAIALHMTCRSCQEYARHYKFLFCAVCMLCMLSMYVCVCNKYGKTTCST